VAIPINDAGLVARTLDEDSDIGTVIIEPSGPSFSMVPLQPGYLQALRDITKQRSRLLIFDEVITGFRWSPGGAQERFGVRPDLTSMAKVVSGGMPGGAVGGRADVMSVLSHPAISSAMPSTASIMAAPSMAIHSQLPRRW
jgi:glutamate-1-semialdehyde 2,1-aminomutase